MHEENIVTNETDLKGQVDEKEAIKPKKRRLYTLVKSKRGTMVPIYEMNETRASAVAFWDKDFKLPNPKDGAVLSGIQADIAVQIAAGHPSQFKTVAGFTAILETLGVDISYRKILNSIGSKNSKIEVEGICILYTGAIYVTGRTTKGKGAAPIEKVKRTFEAKNKQLRSALDAALND